MPYVICIHWIFGSVGGSVVYRLLLLLLYTHNYIIYGWFNSNFGIRMLFCGDFFFGLEMNLNWKIFRFFSCRRRRHHREFVVLVDFHLTLRLRCVRVCARCTVWMPKAYSAIGPPSFATVAKAESTRYKLLRFHHKPCKARTRDIEFPSSQCNATEYDERNEFELIARCARIANDSTSNSICGCDGKQSNDDDDDDDDMRSRAPKFNLFSVCSVGRGRVLLSN